MMHPHHADDSSRTDRVLGFASAVFRRADGPDDLVPADHRIDWRDRPARYRTYPGVPSIPLATPGRLFERYSRFVQERNSASMTLELLGTMLQVVAAPLQRRLDINWNWDTPPIGFQEQEFRRGSASGGGLYPTQLYLVDEREGSRVPGLYHYAAAQHALVPLRHGAFTAQVAAALSGTRPAVKHDVYLLVSSDFWQNCFKYHNFGYHVCSMDIGLALETVQLVCDAFGISHRGSLTFNDAVLNALVGADSVREGVFAVLGLGNVRAADRATQSFPSLLPVPRPRERSARVEIAPDIVQMHSATSTDEAALARLWPLAEPALQMADESPPLSPIEARILDSLPSVLLERRSAWGSLRGREKLGSGTLLALLEFMDARFARSARSIRERLSPGTVDLVLQSNSVDGLKSGAYRWDSQSRSLLAIDGTPPMRWQSTYSMNNYNLDEAACLLFVTGSLARAVASFGPPGYRVLNGYVGVISQLVYTGAAALGVDCGAVLGVRNQAVKNTITVQRDHDVLIAFYLGASQPRSYLFDFSLVPDVPRWK